jgi:REP-associated tyrosine transposase
MEQNYVQFFTASILKWKPLLLNNDYKEIIIRSLEFLTINKRVKVFGFVIMPNHIHLLWQVSRPHELRNVQRDFMKYCSQQIQKDLRTNDPLIHKEYEVNLKDRKFQIWQRNPLSVDLFSRKVIEQRLDYIHNNPVQGKWMLSTDPSDYRYSSVRFYEEENHEFTLLFFYIRWNTLKTNC